MARRHARVGYGLPTLLAVGLHGLVLLVSVISLPVSDREPKPSSIVQATLVSTETVTNQAQRAEASRQRALARQAEEQRLAEEQAQQEAEAAAARETQQRSEQEAERQAEKEAREATRQAAKAEAERRAAETEDEAQRLEQQRQAEEEARQAREAEAQRLEEEAEEQARREQEAEERRQREQAEAEMQRLIEGADEPAANAQQGQQAANDFTALVRQAIEQAWRIPPNISSGAAVEISVRLGPSGELFATEVSTSSGNDAFDRSAVQAVEAAAPFAELRQLPAHLQREYRRISFVFSPEGVR